MVPNEPEDDKTRTHIVLTDGTMVGHYRIINKIGSGGMGDVYLALDTKLSRKVALKFLPPHLCQDDECRKRFTREAQAAAGLDHPNIAGIYEVGEYNGRPFYSMQVVEGQSLREVIAGRDLPIERIIETAIQVCEGLQAAHDKGIIHRDIKPSNILIDGHGRVRVVDFGLASIRGSEHLTKTGSTLGTIGYMSPEQVRGQEIDRRSDLFSFGVVLYELITKQNPFKRDSEAATLKAVSDDTPHPLARFRSKVPDLLESVVAKLLEKQSVHRYQSAAGVVSDLKRIERDSDATIPIDSTRYRSRRTIRFYLPIAVVILAVMAIVFKPWRIELSPRDDVIAAENRLAVMYFDNLNDPTDSLRLGEIITNLLITDLSESRYVQVVSSQRLYDILKQLGHEGEKKVDRGVATQVARKARARWMLLGSILNTEPEIMVTAQLVDVASGDALASQRIKGQPGERIFSVVDQLTVEIKDDLSLPPEAAVEADHSVATVSTHSPEALRHYLEGVDLLEKHYWSDADVSFAKAVELDSTYAIAHYRLAVIAYWSGYPTAKAHIANALRYSDHIGRKAQHYIKSLDARLKRNFSQAIEELKYIIERYPDEKGAYLSLGLIRRFETDEIEDAIECFEKVIDLDPYQREAYNQLAYAYNDLGKYEKSIWAIDKYIEIAPDEANPYDSKGELLALNGRLDEAIVSYEKAMELKPGYGRSRLANLYMFQRDYARAESLYQAIASDGNKETRSRGRQYLARIPLHQGKFRDAIRILEIGIETDRMESAMEANAAEKMWVRSCVNAYIDNIQQAIDEAEQAINILQQHEPNSDFINFSWAQIALWHTQLGNHIAADSIVNRLSVETEQFYFADSTAYWVARAFVSFEIGEFDTAIVLWENMNNANPGDFPAQLYLGRCLLEAGQLGKAVATLEKAMNTYSETRGYWPHLSVLGHYWLALAYEASGWNDKAVEQYEIFLDIWKDADPGLESVDDARKRLATMRGTS